MKKESIQKSETEKKENTKKRQGPDEDEIDS
jgi:hypothetical protein